MKEIDTEAPVVWPAWCYSGNIPTDVLKHSPRGVTASSSSSSSSTSSSSSAASDITSPGALLLCNPAAAVPYNSAALPTTTTTDIGSIVGVANKFRTKRKSHFTTKQLPTESVDDNSIGQHHLIAEKTKESTRLSSPPLIAAAIQQQAHHQHQAQQQTTTKTATASLNAEKMLSDRMLLSGYNAIENNKKLCDSSSAYFFLEKVKNETQMESLKDSESIDNNNVNNTSSNNNNNNNNNNNSSTNNNSLSSNNPSANSNINTNNNNNNSNIINNNNSNSNSTTSNNSVKRERLSPGTNGDVQFSLSRSRSATPSSFRGTPPQATHTTNDIQLHNLSTNLLSHIQSRSSDFPTRNYSDFMRSLAAKYNNSNPNDSGTSRRSTFFENSKVSQTNKSAANNSTNSSSNTNLKEQPSPSEAPKLTQNVQNLTTTTPSVPPFVQSFLSSLPFSPGVFPPLIDMSSTQALVTLARAAKEAEIKNILMSAQKRSSVSNNSASQSPGPNLTAALQQAAQFASPALLYSAQLQQQQQQSQNRQSSPMRDTSANSSGEKNMTASPLDLSSAPPAKRFKAESTSSGGSEKSPRREGAPGTGATVQTPAKSPKVNTTRAPSEVVAATAPTTASVIPMRQCQAQSDEVNAWSVDDVFAFVSSIDICAEYAQNFRDQCIDGSGLPLLTEDHLMNSLGMKLGPALKLKTMLAKKLGGPCPCVSCSSQAQLLAAAQAAAVTVATSSTTSAATSPPSGISNSQHLHPQPNQQQLSVRNSAACNSSSSQSILHGSCGSSIQRPASAESGS